MGGGGRVQIWRGASLLKRGEGDFFQVGEMSKFSAGGGDYPHLPSLARENPVCSHNKLYN